MSIINEYNKALSNIYHHVGFTEKGYSAPIYDCTGKYWKTDGNIIQYGETIATIDEYECAVFKHINYDKSIFRGSDFTLILCDPQVGGVDWFGVFENRLELSF